MNRSPIAARYEFMREVNAVLAQEPNSLDACYRNADAWVRDYYEQHRETLPDDIRDAYQGIAIKGADYWDWWTRMHSDETEAKSRAITAVGDE